MRNRTWLPVLALIAAGCSHPQPLSPYVPPEAMYSTGGTLAAAGGVMAAAIGSSMLENGHSGTTQKAAAGVMAGGAALMGAAILEAIEVQKERGKFVNLYNAFIRNYYGSAPAEGSLRPPLPPPPEVPFEFPVEDSPLEGKDSKP